MSQVKQRIKSKSDSSKKNVEVVKPEEKKNVEVVEPEEKKIVPKFGPLGIKNEDRIWSRGVMFASITIIIVVLKWRKMGQVTWASQRENITETISHLLPCSPKYLDEINRFEGCALKQCGRFVVDDLFQEDQVKTLVKIFKKGLENGRSSGGASILDLHSGALSHGAKFINVFETPGGQELWTKEEIAVYIDAKDKIRNAIAENFGLGPNSIYLTSPTFFSEMTPNPAKTVHDEYWHPHVDKETYETFHFTSLLYLSNYGRDFQGGRFVFVDNDQTNRTVEPRQGRVSMFTSGAENLHYVEKVTKGVRYALTIAFTCNSNQAIPNPRIL